MNSLRWENHMVEKTLLLRNISCMNKWSGWYAYDLLMYYMHTFVISTLVGNDQSMPILVLNMVGKFGITAGFGGIYLYTTELFPTTIRWVAYTFSVFWMISNNSLAMHIVLRSFQIVSKIFDTTIVFFVTENRNNTNSIVWLGRLADLYFGNTWIVKSIEFWLWSCGRLTYTYFMLKAEVPFGGWHNENERLSR